MPVHITYLYDEDIYSEDLWPYGDVREMLCIKIRADEMDRFIRAMEKECVNSKLVFQITDRRDEQVTRVPDPYWIVCKFIAAD